MQSRSMRADRGACPGADCGSRADRGVEALRGSALPRGAATPRTGRARAERGVRRGLTARVSRVHRTVPRSATMERRPREPSPRRGIGRDARSKFRPGSLCFRCTALIRQPVERASSNLVQCGFESHSGHPRLRLPLRRQGAAMRSRTGGDRVPRTSPVPVADPVSAACRACPSRRLGAGHIAATTRAQPVSSVATTAAGRRSWITGVYVDSGAGGASGRRGQLSAAT